MIVLTIVIGISCLVGGFYLRGLYDDKLQAMFEKEIRKYLEEQNIQVEQGKLESWMAYLYIRGDGVEKAVSIIMKNHRFYLNDAMIPDHSEII